ncbi:ribonuclease H, partial [Trifolium pratense]
MSYTWKSILQSSWVIKKGSYWTIGSGQETNIWEDNWIQQKGNSTRSSPKPDNCNLIKVKELMDNNYNEWNESIINQVFTSYDAQMILQIPIIDKTQPDTLTWDDTKDGIYSVKSGYHAIIDWDSNSNTNNAASSNRPMEIWKTLWKFKVPPKYSHLLWRILNNAIPVKGNLFKKGVKCDPLCPRCLNHVESIQHVFLECEWAKKVWFASPLTLNLNLNQLTDFYDWFTFVTNNTDKDCMEKILAIIYEIWNVRNLLVFQEKNLPPQEISSNAFKKLHEYQSHGEVKTQKSQTSPPSTNSCSNNISWSPPLRGTLKINVDAHLSSDGHWFAGMVLRRSDGSAVGAATRVHKGMTDVVMGEAMGLNDAIDWIEKMEKHQVVFEMDSQIIVNAVRNREEIRKNWGSVVRRCIRFLKDNPNSDLVWVNRKANRVAHEIAKWAEHEPNSDWNECVPMCVWPLIQKDKG